MKNIKSLEGTKEGDSGDTLLFRTGCSPAVKTWKLLGVCCCWAKLLTNEELVEKYCCRANGIRREPILRKAGVEVRPLIK